MKFKPEGYKKTTVSHSLHDICIKDCKGNTSDNEGGQVVKITGDHHVQSNVPVRKESSVSGERDSAFSRVLENSVKASSAKSAQPALSMQPVIRPMMEVPMEQVYTQTDQMINALDQYQRLLADDRLSLRDVDPAMQQMKRELKTLEPLAETLPPSHPMKAIVSETVLTAAKEIARFEGGAYVPDEGDTRS